VAQAARQGIGSPPVRGSGTDISPVSTHSTGSSSAPPGLVTQVCLLGSVQIRVVGQLFVTPAPKRIEQMMLPITERTL
jgi:hypothetical protein